MTITTQKHLCVCNNKNNSRILYSKEECELQIIFYYYLPTEMIRTVSEYLYQPHIIKIKYKKRMRVSCQHDFIMEEKILYNCSSCFLYNFLSFKEVNPLKMPRLRNDINWFNEITYRKIKKSKFEKYYDDIFKYNLPLKYEMCFYRSQGVILIKNNGDVIQDEEDFKKLCNIKQIIITVK